jgi:hypothetical protein
VARLEIDEKELSAWASLTERLLLLERAAKAHVRKPSRKTLEELRRALARRPRP